MTIPIQRGSRRYTGVSLRPEIMDYLDQLVAQTQTSRSWVLNTLVAEHARNTGFAVGGQKPPNVQIIAV